MCKSRRSVTVALGIDPGIAITGYGFVWMKDDGTLEAGKFGVILTPAGAPPQDRLLMLYRDLTRLMSSLRPDACAVEKLFFQRNVSTAISVGQARGVVMLALAEAGVQFAEYTPNEVKQAVVGYGSAEKKQVQEMVRVLLHLSQVPKPDDAADALAVAITHLHTTRYGSTDGNVSI